MVQSEQCFILNKPKMNIRWALIVLAINFLFIAPSLASERGMKNSAEQVGQRASIVGLSNAIVESRAYGKSIENIKKDINTLSKAQKTLGAKLGRYKWAKHLRSYSKSKSGMKAFETLSKRVNEMELGKVQKTKALSKLKKLIKIPITKGSVFKAGKGMKTVGQFGKGIGKVAKFAGPAATVVSVVTDLALAKDRIKRGSTQTLENLNIALKVVEYFQPTIPFAKTPSDVARAIIDLGSNLKQKNKSISSGNKILNDSVLSFVGGEASFEAYIARAMNSGSLKKQINNEGAETAYKNIKKEYINKHLIVVEGFARKRRASLEVEQLGINNKDERAFYDSSITASNQAYKALVHKRNNINEYNEGLDLVKSYAAVISAQKNITKSSNALIAGKIKFDKSFVKSSELANDMVAKFQENLVQQAKYENVKNNQKTKRKILVLHAKKKLNSLKNRAESIRQENLQLVEALKKDPANKELQHKLNDNAQTYLDLRAKIRKTDPEFGVPIDTAATVSSRGNKYANKTAKDALDKKRFAVQGKIKQRNAIRKKLIAELSQKVLAQQKTDRKKFENNQQVQGKVLNNKISNAQQSRNAKQRQLEKLNRLQGRTETVTEKFSGSNSSQVWVSGNSAQRSELESTVKNLGYLATYKKARKSVGRTIHLISDMDSFMQARLKKLSGTLGVPASKLFILIDYYYKQQQKTLAKMPNTSGYYKPISTPTTYSRQVTKLVGLTNSEQTTYNQLTQDINRLDTKLSTLRNNLNNLSNTRYSASTQLLNRQQELGNLVTNYLSSTKTQIGITQGAQANYVYYAGLISFINNGTTIGADFEGTTTQTPPSVGMSMRNVNNMDGVFNGNFTIASKVSSDSSGPYNYLSWGLWSASNPATFAQNTGLVTSLVSGGEWLMGSVAHAIPKQGSASYVGQLSGDFMSGGNPRSRGVMSGSINFNANFATNKLNGSLNILKNGSFWASSTITNGQVVFDPGNGGSAHIQGGLSGGSAGGITGGLFGKNGATPTESGGLWWLRKANNTSAGGLYRAKKQ